MLTRLATEQLTFDASGIKVRQMWELFNWVRTGPGMFRSRGPPAAVHTGSPCRPASSRLRFAFPWFSWSELFLESSCGFLDGAIAFLGKIDKDAACVRGGEFGFAGGKGFL